MTKPQSRFFFLATALQCNQSLSEEINSHSFWIEDRNFCTGDPKVLFIVRDGAVLNFICLPVKVTSRFGKP